MIELTEQSRVLIQVNGIMIDILAKVKINNNVITMSGEIDPDQRKIELKCHTSDFPSTVLFDSSILFSLMGTATFTGKDSKPYTAYGVKFFSKEVQLMNNGILTLYGSFSRLIREYESDQKYSTISFAFDGIERLFRYEKFESDYSQNDIAIHKNGSIRIEQQLTDSLSCIVHSYYEGVIASTDLYHINLKQDKRITIESTNLLDADEWITIIQKIKLYFEFVINQEIRVRDVRFSNKENDVRKKATLVSDQLLSPKTYIKVVEERPYNGTEQELLAGLSRWMNHFNEYKRTIEIWQKTIYNVNVQAEDVFIWEAQAFEILCETNKKIYDLAVSLKAPNQKYPNLYNYLLAAQTELNFSKHEDVYYYDIKEVRDYYTHNNPDKSITSNQKTNSFRLIHYILRKSISCIFVLPKIKGSYILIPIPKS